MVYVTFRNIGYPTDPHERTQFLAELEKLEPSRQTFTEANDGGSFSQPPLITSPLDLPDENYNVTSGLWANSSTLMATHQQMPATENVEIPSNSDHSTTSNWPLVAGNSSSTYETENILNPSDVSICSEFDEPAGTSSYWTAELAQHHGNFDVDETIPSMDHTSQIVPPLSGPGSTSVENREGLSENPLSGYDGQHHSFLSWGPLGLTNQWDYYAPSPVNNIHCSGRNWSPKANSVLRSIFNRSKTPEKRDSAYASGRNSPSATLVEDTPPHPSSLLEFKGLHRVPCQRLHEPQPLDTIFVPNSKSMERFKDIPTCSQCHYASIHNLSWSARYLKPAVFVADLKLDTK
jgi:hypothetical protein